MYPEKRLPSVELALGMHFNECSIAAADANRRAYELINDDDRSYSTLLYFPNPSIERPLAVESTVIPLLDDVALEDGRQIGFVLAQPSGHDAPRLMALARGNIAFPIASFRRREGSLCDYIQVGNEINADDLVVTTQDETSRKDVIEIIREIIGIDPLAHEHAGVLSDDWIKDIDVAAKIAVVNNSFEKNNVIRPQLSEEHVYQRAILEKICGLGTVWEASDMRYYGYSQSRTKKYHTAAQATLSHLEQVDISDIIEGKLPGSDDSFYKKALLRLALDARGITQQNVMQAKVKAKSLSTALGVSSQIRENLGKYDPRLEKAIQFASSLSMKHVGVTKVIEDFQYASTRADTELTVYGSSDDKDGVFTVSVSARPLAMERSNAVLAGVYVVDRLVPTTLHDDELQEISDLADLTES